MRPTCIRLALLLLIAVCVTPTPAAEPRDRGVADGAALSGDEAEPGRDGRRWGGRHRRGPGMFGGSGLERLFPPDPNDQDPLSPEESAQLREFVDAEFPTLAKMLQHLQQQRPETFAERFQQAAPRLRQLRRIHEADPNIARAVIAHAGVSRKIQAQQRAWHFADLTDAQRQQLAMDLRETVAASVRLEARALGAYLQHSADERDALIERRLQWLLVHGADLPELPPEVRALVDQAQTATDQIARHEARTALRDRIAERLDSRADALRTRMIALRDNPAEEVDGRVEMLKSEPPRRGPGRGDGDHRRGRRFRR